MRRTHLDFFKSLGDSIGLENIKTGEIQHPFENRFLEIYPSEQDIIEQFPCLVLYMGRVQNRLDARLNQANRIEPVVRDRTKYNRYFVKHFSQEFNYELHFWISDPAFEIFSTPERPGIIDQALLYLSENRSRTYRPSDSSAKEIEWTLDPGESYVNTGSAKDRGVYQLVLQVKIKDGLYVLKEEETLANVTLEIEEPVEVEIINI